MEKDQDTILRASELTGIIGRSEMDSLNKEHGDKWTRYREKYDQASNLEMSDFPIQIDFELNASCNLRCPMCPISAESPKGKGVKTWFDFNFFKRIVAYAAKRGTRAIKLNYINEPFIRKDIFNFINYAAEQGILDIYLSTNGVLMDERMRENILSSKLTRIQVSIDAVSENIYDKVRPGGDFIKVIENTKKLISERDRMKKKTPLVRVNFVRTEINEHELNQFIADWEDKADMVGIQEFISPPNSSEKITSKTSVNKFENDFKCSFPFKQLVITNEKKVLPCCTFWGEKLELGEINEPEDLDFFWNSERINFIRDIHKKGHFYKIEQCKSCVGC